MATEPGTDRPAATRLERMLARLQAQLACLEFARREISGDTGLVLELGLGKGRTYDHLRRLFGARAVYAFDREVHAPPDCVPDADHLLLGDFRDTLAAARERLREPVVLVHADVGSEDRARDRALANDLAPLIDRLLAPGALVISDREMHVQRWAALTSPAGGDWPYYLWRVTRAPR